MRIALLCDEAIPVPPVGYGGTERVVALLARGLVERGHEVTVFCARGSSAAGTVVQWPVANNHSRAAWARNAFTFVRHLVRQRYDVVSCHTNYRYLYLAPLAMRARRFYTWHVAISDAMARKIRGRMRETIAFNGISQSQVAGSAFVKVAIHHGLDLDRFAFRSHVESDAPLVFLGAVSRAKGVDTAVRVARRTGRRLIIAGVLGKPNEPFFDEHVRPHLGEDVEFVGEVDDTQKASLLGSAAALLMPVRVREAFGLVMVEALACGTPVIGLDIGSVGEIVADGVTGFVCANEDDMVAAVSRLGAIDRRACRQDAESRFGYARMVSGYERLFAGAAA